MKFLVVLSLVLASVAISVSVFTLRTRRSLDEPVVFNKRFHWDDYPEYPINPNPGSFMFNEVRYMRRYRGYETAKEVLRQKFVLDYLVENNTQLKMPTDDQIKNYVDSKIEWFTGMGNDDPENPMNDPDDE